MRDLSLHLMDIIQNSITARAQEIGITINADKASDLLSIEVRDNGTGMDQETLMRVVDPFVTSRKTRRVGLGIPLFKASAERAEGRLDIVSSIGKGTSVTALFKISNIDRPPIGKISDTFTSCLSANPELDFKLVLRNGTDQVELDTKSMRQLLKGVSIKEYEVLEWVRGFIDEGIKRIFGGVLNEIPC